MPDRIVLVGFMGAGKSTVGREVAALLGWTFLDMDRAIEVRTGVPIATLFRDRGEAFFRAQELSLAVEVGSLGHHVIAAGGGAFASGETREALRAGAVTVWLRSDLETLLARIPNDGSRPMAGSRETIQRLFAEREPSYRLADRVVDASLPTPLEVARRVVETVFPERAQGAWENEGE